MDTSTSLEHCGECNDPCAGGANTEAVCNGGICEVNCETGFLDCNGDPADGCEINNTQCPPPGETDCADRVDNDGGYVEDNVVTACNFCNQAKHTHTRAEFEEWAKRVAARL